MPKSFAYACDACGRDITLKPGGGYRLHLQIDVVWEANALLRQPDPYEFFFCDPACLRDGLDREHPSEPGRRLIALPAPREPDLP